MTKGEKCALMGVVRFGEVKMTTITKDYQLTITARGGEVIADIDLKDYNLDKSIARADIMNDIQNFVEVDMARNKDEVS